MKSREDNIEEGMEAVRTDLAGIEICCEHDPFALFKEGKLTKDRLVELLAEEVRVLVEFIVDRESTPSLAPPEIMRRKWREYTESK